MTRANKGLVLLLVATLGLWGCVKGPARGPAGAERIRALESKNAKLEDDFRSAAATRDQLRKKLANLQQQLDHLQGVIKERDELKQLVCVRSGERDALQSQIEQLRKGIRSLLGQAEAAGTGSTEKPVTSTFEVSLPGKS